MKRRFRERRSVLTRSAPAPTLHLSYGEHPDQVADYYRATVATSITVLLLHGGFWEEEFDRAHCRPLAVALAGHGVTVIVPEYRRVGGAGGWPYTFDDVREGCHRLSESHGPTQRLLLMGHSAGGQLALWLAVNDPPARLAGVMALAPISNLGQAERIGLGGGAISRLMGGPVEQVPDRYALVDPSRLAEPDAPTTILHGSHDSIVPLSMSRDYVADRPNVVLVEEACGHFELIDPTTSSFDRIVDYIRGFG
jgi:acetyl esterase/lipase